jgi:RNA polymerase sigma factor (sigma-70 family)
MADDGTGPSRSSAADARAALDALCAAAARGDRAAGDTLYVRFAPGLRRLLQERVATADLAEDLLQRTWMNAWAALSSGRYDPKKGSFSTFVYTIANHIWLQHLRSARRTDARFSRDGEIVERAESMDRWSGGAAGSGDPAALAQFGQKLDSVRRLLRGEPVGSEVPNTLTEDERAVLRAVASGVSDRGLAARLNLAPSTANARKRSAFEKLRRALAELGFRQDEMPKAAERTADPGE